ncbi:hypothetical protein [Desulfonema magnum]|uniref:hypothetical protein n=1 Tax=Desulfonema magnum TaxID=45655 RepID=UPI001A9A86C7|nr:hypothetical protein [Desulfonema magnum]
MQKTASLYFCTPEKNLSQQLAKNRFALFLHSGKNLSQQLAKNRFALFLHSGKKSESTPCKKPLRSIFALRKKI